MLNECFGLCGVTCARCAQAYSTMNEAGEMKI